MDVTLDDRRKRYELKHFHTQMIKTVSAVVSYDATLQKYAYLNIASSRDTPSRRQKRGRHSEQITN